MTPQAFVDKWRDMALKERSASQPHFIDLCHLLGKPTPLDVDKTGDWYTFERGAEKTTGAKAGGSGWADVWKKGCFAWEYKGPKKDLRAAYDQLQQYRESLENPPLLIVSDMAVIEVHTNFTDSVKKVYRFTLDDLLEPRRLDLLGKIFDEPTAFRVAVTPADVTRDAAAEFARLADILRDQGVDAHQAAHYLIRLLFCLFAEDSGLLPNNAFTKLVEATKDAPEQFTMGMRQLFGAMAKGGLFGFEKIPHFNGRLFDDDQAVPLSRNGIRVLSQVAKLDWSSIEPSIFGTLFERSLDPSKRAQLGAHYTSREDILLIVEPVLMAPLRRRWNEVRAEVEELVARREAATDRGQRTKLDGEISGRLLGFMAETAKTTVLDPACGSGNFLYVSLRSLLDLWKEVWVFMGEAGVGRPLALEDVTPSPTQLYGIEINEFAAELAQVTIWIGYIQWLRDNGFGTPAEPILKPLDTIENRDAILAYDAEGRPVEPEWPAADVVVGNPPFLGAQKQLRELGDHYTGNLRLLYRGRVPAGADLVTYWFEKSRSMIEDHHTRRAGLIATQAIRSGASRIVLDHIAETATIFTAWSDRPWVLDGANVRVSIIAFDGGNDDIRTLNGISVLKIHSDLTGGLDLTTVSTLDENANISYKGIDKSGPFELTKGQAYQMLASGGNPNGKPNSDVIRPWFNGRDITDRSADMWIVDFGSGMSIDAASEYVVPFEYVSAHVRPERAANRETRRRELWWEFGRSRPAMRDALGQLARFIVTPRVAKHRLFVFLGRAVVPDSRLFVFARDDDYFFGVLHSRPHEVWSLATSSRHGVGNDPTYNNTTCFETFPFPWPPGHEPIDDPRVTAIADAARDLVEKRDRWLNPEGASEAELKKRTLTNLYNQRPTWLDLAHKRLDAAVFAAYGWPDGLTDEEVLERLLELNSERAGTAAR